MKKNILDILFATEEHFSKKEYIKYGIVAPLFAILAVVLISLI